MRIKNMRARDQIKFQDISAGDVFYDGDGDIYILTDEKQAVRLSDGLQINHPNEGLREPFALVRAHIVVED